MAIKDNLKHFKDFDGYSGNLTKADMDYNLDYLADSIEKGDKAVEDKILFKVGEFNTIVPKNNSLNKFALKGDGSEFSVSSSKSFFGVSNFGLHMQYQASYPLMVISKEFINTDINTFLYSDILQNVTKTTDDTETEIFSQYFISNDVFIVNFNVVASKDDLSKIWAFTLQAVFKQTSDGLSRLDNNDINSIVKDDDDLSFSISTDDGLRCKVKGKSDETYYWGIEVDIKRLFHD